MNRAIRSLPREPEPNPPTDWRAIRESLRRDLDRALLGDIALANVYTHVSLGGSCRFCGGWSMGTRCADCLTVEGKHP